MSRDRVASAAVYALLLLALVLALAGCGGVCAQSDPAVWAAVRFEQAHCTWDWHQTRQAYLAAQQQLATLRAVGR